MEKERVVKYLFRTLWIVLLCNVFVKLTFGYWRPIIVENERLMAISYYIDNNIWLEKILDYFFYIGNGLLITLCCIKEKWFKDKKHIIIYFIVYTLLFIIHLFFYNLGKTLMMINYIVLPMFLTKNKYRWIFITFIMDNVLSVLSLYIRGYIVYFDDTYVIGKVLYIDYYIMFIIYYIGGVVMGSGMVLPWFVKQETILKAKLQKAKDKGDVEEVANIQKQLEDLAIKKLEEEQRNDA